MLLYQILYEVTLVLHISLLDRLWLVSSWASCCSLTNRFGIWWPCNHPVNNLRTCNHLVAAEKLNKYWALATRANKVANDLAHFKDAELRMHLKVLKGAVQLLSPS